MKMMWAFSGAADANEERLQHEREFRILAESLPMHRNIVRYVAQLTQPLPADLVRDYIADTIVLVRWVARVARG